MFIYFGILLLISLINGYPFDNNQCLNYCSNDGICLIENNESICYCLPEWDGERCDFIREEQPKPSEQILRNSPCNFIPNLCNGNGVCYVSNDNGTKLACQCKEDWSGPRCDQVSVCKGYCENGGICTEGATANDPPKCKCTEKYDGARCQIMKTTTTKNPPTTTTDMMCSYLPTGYCGIGTCVFNGQALTCQCPSTHTGEQCQNLIGGTQNPGPIITVSSTSGPIITGSSTSGPINPVVTNPTSNGRSGCSSNPCQHGRPCYNNGNTYYCYCGNLYHGINCENNIG